MRRFFLLIVFLFLFTGCVVPQMNVKKNEEDTTTITPANTCDYYPREWPTTWQEVLDCGEHTCVFDAIIEADDSVRFFYYVYQREFSHDYQQEVKTAFLEAGMDPRKETAPTDALVEAMKKHSIVLEWGGPTPVWQLESWIVDYGGYVDNNGEDEGGHLLAEVNIAEEDAQELADELLDKIKISNCTLARGEKARIIDSPSHKTLCEGWDFLYLPSFSGYIPISFYDLQQYGALPLPYTKNEPPYTLEKVDIMISESGCTCLAYSNPVDFEKGGLAENDLLDFELVKHYFKQYFMEGCIHLEINGTEYDPIVQRIVLSYAFQKDEDAAQLGADGMLRPVWVALFTTEFESSLASNPISYVCIDAISGELVTPDSPVYSLMQ